MIEAADYLALSARLQPERLAARDLATERSWSYRELDRFAGGCAAALIARGIGVGERVAALARNRVALIALHVACARIGAIYVPLNWRLAPGEIAKLIADSEPRFTLSDDIGAATPIETLDLQAFLDEAAATPPSPALRIERDRPSLILYTSGTSGRPKGALLSEGAIDQTAINFSLLARVTHESVFLCDTPMFHVIGLVATVRSALMRGGALMISDGFAVARTLARLGDRALGVTHYFCVPAMAAMLRADPGFDAGRLRGLTAIFTGGAPHPPAAIRRWLAEGIAIADGFGMSETGTVTCMPLDLGLIDAHAGSAGLAPPGVSLRIVDEQGEERPPGEAGELLIRGANVTRGYWRSPAETEAAFTSDGWLRSGDIARVDADGYLWIVDRKKDMFISGGENVYPAEIEAALASHPDIAECAVVGVPDEKWGEVGHLACAPRPGRRIAASEITAYLRERLAHYKTPRAVTILEAIPRNGAGKIMKARLREILAEGAGE